MRAVQVFECPALLVRLVRVSGECNSFLEVLFCGSIYVLAFSLFIFK